MPLVLEDGTGLANANTFALVATVDAFATDRGDPFKWLELDEAEVKVPKIILASDYLRNEMRYQYRGSRATATQRMPFPRIGCSFYRGPVVPENVVPWPLIDATCELAMRLGVAGTDLQPDLERGGKVQTETVGPITTTFMKDALSETLIQVVQGILQPLLLSPASIISMPRMAADVTDPVFVDGAFNYPGALRVP